MALVVKTALDPQTLVAQERAAVQAIDPEQPISDVRTMDQWMGRSLQTRRAPTLLLALFVAWRGDARRAGAYRGDGAGSRGGGRRVLSAGTRHDADRSDGGAAGRVIHLPGVRRFAQGTAPVRVVGTS